MISPPSDVIAFTLGPVSVHWYGILIALGVIVGSFVAVREVKRRSLRPEVIHDIILWCGIPGIIGARLYYVVFNWNAYASNVVEVFAVWHGGLAIHGALIGGTLGFLVYVKKKQIKAVWSYLDCIILGVLAGQIIGRWGNFVNQEAFGGPTTYSWGMYIDPQNRPAAHSTVEFFHPTFLYESLWNLVVLLVLLYLNKKDKLKVGQTVALYAVLYGIGRFWIEALRTDSLMIGSLRAAQLVSILMIIGGVVLYPRFTRNT